MDLTFGKEELAFQQEVRDWLKENLTPEILGEIKVGRNAYMPKERLIWCQGFPSRLRLRPRLAQDQGGARGRRLHRQRPEDLDDARPPPPTGSSAWCAPNPDGQAAGGHLLPADRHEDAGHLGASRSSPPTAIVPARRRSTRSSSPT
jgi:hypothetical protein